MAKKIDSPTRIEAAGNKPKEILEFIGAVNSGNLDISIAKMKSPPGWEEPPQTPEFEEFTIILNGEMEIKTSTETIVLKPMQTFIAKKGEEVQYTTPKGAEYIAVCLPAFSPKLVHRKEVG